MKLQIEIDLSDEDIARIEKFLGRRVSSPEIRRFLDEEIAQSLRDLRSR
ncbi:MAG: hypothetical protein ABI577_05435 [bacterium]